MWTVTPLTTTVQTLLTTTADELARETGFVRRSSKLRGAHFVQALVLGWLNTPNATVQQLAQMAGRWVDFHTGLAVLCGDREQSRVETYRVRLRNLSEAAVAAYVTAERPLECAGSFRIEGLGIALMEELQGRDYTALIGLPLVALTEMLGDLGVDVLCGGPAR